MPFAFRRADIMPSLLLSKTWAYEDGQRKVLRFDVFCVLLLAACAYATVGTIAVAFRDGIGPECPSEVTTWLNVYGITAMVFGFSSLTAVLYGVGVTPMSIVAFLAICPAVYMWIWTINLWMRHGDCDTTGILLNGGVIAISVVHSAVVLFFAICRPPPPAAPLAPRSASMA